MTYQLQSGSIGWFARHEFALSWRDFMRMMSAGKSGREATIMLVIGLTAFGMHAVAYFMLHPFVTEGIFINKQLLVLISGTWLLTFSLMMSQAMELVTRAFYSRSDLDLILSSPVSIRTLFTVRIGAIATATTLLALLLSAPAINVMALLHDVRWLSAYPVAVASGMLATALSLAITIIMFRTLGAKRTRLASQIVAAVVGAGFVIGIQLAAISSIGSISRFEFLQSETLLSQTPSLKSWIWIPARAIMGDQIPFLITIVLPAGLFLTAIVVFSGSFASNVMAAAGTSFARNTQNAKTITFRQPNLRSALRHKEWKLLLRDHWLLSQTLMQILYLIPPAFMLWQGYAELGLMGVVVVPVLVMASGQLAGGLAWLAISGEDAPELVATAPVGKRDAIRAKVEAVLGAMIVVVSPILLIMAFVNPAMAILALICVMAASTSATFIQLWFRSPAKRSNFRRRQTSSKVATIAEALSSILWAATAALIAAKTWLVVVPLASVFIVLWIARSFRSS